MIQRIQTIYLLLATVVISLTLFLPLATIWQGGNELVVKAFFLDGEMGIKAPLPIYMGIILAVATLLPFVTIFLFKKRMLQIRLTIFSSVVLIGYYMALVAYIFMLADEASFSPSWTICLPFVALILNWLAIRGIGADEALVKAYDRLR